ncbi:hypothetical protein GWK08_13850 [Leptobacterium flavescens]|uniref:Uncharacterized protein n=2 Tax=Leptobacterium flavescens TaxID=472055 RepID=A0A6P0UUP1_9FLAO|nr:hypothetical protein [Leptobacterium flavescens]
MTAMLRPVAPVFTYIINQDYIAEFLCINQDRPELKCNGKCYMFRQLKAQSEEKKQNLPAIDLRDYPIGFVELLDFQPQNKIPVQKTGSIYLNNYALIFSGEIFHPPAGV